MPCKTLIIIRNQKNIRIIQIIKNKIQTTAIQKLVSFYGENIYHDQKREVFARKL